MKASILINNYNYEAYVEKAIASALNQSYEKVEVIVYDDGSKDQSLQKIEKFSKDIITIAKPNYGRGHCWNQINAVNEAFKKSTGDIIFLMDSDDWFFEDKVRKVVEIFNKNPNAVYVQHRFDLVDEEDNRINAEKRPLYSGINILDGIYYTKRLDFFFTQTSGQCFKRSFLEKILPLKEDDLSMICVDIRLTRYAAFEGEIITLQDKLSAYRVHTKNHSSVLKDKNYYTKYEKQHLNFFNSLSQKYSKPYLKKENSTLSYLKVLVLLFRANMNSNQKINFLTAWFKSYINK
ncbi:glycosyltransferase [Spirosoma sp. RP8]|uniref:Glycosyltransferase n=1 Tax=Spirosoma liriopis TaxID=2937440 RepID=A0ABT0HKU0_9BACT|nr:glycosyltransferase [Spirosoma liriopis]MCK8492776.1 glycosyltransferase [Spirosoma liriopis]